MLLMDQGSLEINIFTIAFITILGVMIISRRLRSDKTVGDHIFLILSIFVLISDALCFFRFYLSNFLTGNYDKAGLLLNTLIEITVLFMAYQWLLFVGYTVFGSLDYLKRRYWAFFIPIPVIILMLLINVFVPFLFVFDTDYYYGYYSAYFIVAGVEALYIIVSAALIHWNNTKKDRMHRFNFIPVLLPLLLIPVIYYITGIRVDPASYTVSVVFLFISMTERWQYDDEEAGFFNNAYLEYMKELVREGRKDYRCALLLECEGDERVLSEMIRGELPREVEKVHVSIGKFEFFSKHGIEDLMDMICEDLNDAAAEYDKTHEGMHLGLKCIRKYRNAGESAEEFLKRIEE